jgi:hypothetical protein
MTLEASAFARAHLASLLTGFAPLLQGRTAFSRLGSELNEMGAENREKLRLNP